MYYHLIMEDGLKQKDLSIDEIEKIVNEEEVSYNNARIYSSEKKLNEVYESYKEELTEEGKDISFENIKIEKLISIAERKNDLQNSSYKFFLDIKNPRGKINLMNFLNKTFIIWIMLLSTILNRYLFYILYKYYYSFTSYKLFFGFNVKPLWYITLIYILVPLSLILFVWYRDKYFKKNYLIIFIILMIIINEIIAYTIGDIIEDITKNFGGLIAIIVGLIFTQLFYNFFRRLSYNKYKDF